MILSKCAQILKEVGLFSSSNECSCRHSENDKLHLHSSPILTRRIVRERKVMFWHHVFISPGGTGDAFDYLTPFL